MQPESDIRDGVHFGLDADTYHSIAALSSTGIKNLLISGPDFWYRTPWLNPDYVDEDSEAKIIGRAYHARILEGREVFYDNYAPTFEAPPDCIKTVDDLKDSLIKCGIEKHKRAKADLIEQLLEVQPGAQIYDQLSGRLPCPAPRQGISLAQVDCEHRGSSGNDRTASRYQQVLHWRLSRSDRCVDGKRHQVQGAV